MKKLFALSAFVAMGIAVQAAPAKAERTVDQMTCAQAQNQVKRTKRYYIRTVDGAIPITHVDPVGGLQPCGRKQRLNHHFVQTRDSARCHVGYTCGEAN